MMQLRAELQREANAMRDLAMDGAHEGLFA